MDLQKKQTISGLATEKDDPQAMSRNLAAVLNFGKGHYRGEVMTEETVANVTMEDVKKYYNTYFRPNVAYMAIVGDITMDEAKKQVEKYFGAWKKKSVPRRAHDNPAVKGKLVGQITGIADGNDLRRRIVAHEPGRKGNRYGNRFEVARRQGDDRACCRGARSRGEVYLLQ